MHKYYLWSRYRLTTRNVQQFLERQHHQCGVCGDSLESGYAIDHDHACCPGRSSCGECVRGLLCRRCNVLVGYVEGTPRQLLARVGRYILRFKDRKRGARRRYKVTDDALAHIISDAYRTPRRVLGERFGISEEMVRKLQQQYLVQGRKLPSSWRTPPEIQQ